MALTVAQPVSQPVIKVPQVNTTDNAASRAAASSPYQQLLAIGTQAKATNTANATAAASAAEYAAQNIPGSPGYAAAHPQTTAANGQSITSGGGALAPNQVDLQAKAYYTDLANNTQSQIDALGGQQNQLIDNINHGADEALKNTNDSYAAAERNYNLARDGTIADNELAKGQIDEGVAANTNSLQRLLGIAGSGNSSAANYAAFAAAKQGTDQRSGVQRSYDRNRQSQDINFGDTTANYKGNIGKIGEGRQVKTNGVLASINNNKTSLLNTLAGLKVQAGQAGGQDYTTARGAATPYENMIREASAKSAGLMKDYANPIFDTAGVAFKAPTLESYNQPMAGAVRGTTNTNEQISPAYYNLLKKDPNGNILA